MWGPLPRPGLTPQKPGAGFLDRDEDRISVWIRMDWPTLKNGKYKSCIVFLDKFGFLMAPLVRHRGNPCGHTPHFVRTARSHTKGLAIAALCWYPVIEGVFLGFRLFPNENANALKGQSFLEQLKTELSAPVTVIWDDLSVHKSHAAQTYLRSQQNLTNASLRS